MAHHVYTIWTPDGIYTGYSSDPVGRFLAHLDGTGASVLRARHRDTVDGVRSHPEET